MPMKSDAYVVDWLVGRQQFYLSMEFLECTSIWDLIVYTDLLLAHAEFTIIGTQFSNVRIVGVLLL